MLFAYTSTVCFVCIFAFVYRCGHGLVLHLHICARASPRHLHELSYSSVSVRMNYSRNTNRHSSSLTRVRKTVSRASATHGKTNDATNDEANMRLVRSSFALLFASPLVQMCNCCILITKIQILIQVS